MRTNRVNLIDRPAWCIPMGMLLAWQAGAALWWAAPLALALWLGLMIGHGERQDMGTMPPGYTGTPEWLTDWWLPSPAGPQWVREAWDWLAMAVIGFVRAAIPATLLIAAGVDVGKSLAFMTAWSLLHPACYAVAARLYRACPWGDDMLHWAELIFGFTIAAAAILVLN